jgi:hypothetical protein
MFTCYIYLLHLGKKPLVTMDVSVHPSVDSVSSVVNFNLTAAKNTYFSTTEFTESTEEEEAPLNCYLWILNVYFSIQFACRTKTLAVGICGLNP